MSFYLDVQALFLHGDRIAYYDPFINCFAFIHKSTSLIAMIQKKHDNIHRYRVKTTWKCYVITLNALTLSRKLRPYDLYKSLKIQQYTGTVILSKILFKSTQVNNKNNCIKSRFSWNAFTITVINTFYTPKSMQWRTRNESRGWCSKG